MKISCQSCGAKYNIADEKVRGKIVKIACKKCGARIEIDGREPAEQAHDQDETRVFDQAAVPPPAADTWTASIDDNDQREVTTAQLIDLMRQGVVTPDTFVWRDGMADWQAVRDVAELQSAVQASVPPAPAAPAFPSEPPTAAYAAPTYDAPAGGNGGGAPLPSAGYGGGPIMGEPSQPARLGGSRRGGAVDLFAAQAPGAEEEDVATSAPAGPALGAMAPGMAMGGGKPIGARNENSVLFSLSALTASGPSPAGAAVVPSDEEKSGLIDIQKLAAAAKPVNGARDDRAKLDDIMNLGGGGAFGTALGAPILAPPPAAALAESPAAEESKKSNKGLILAMGGIVALLLVVVIVLLATRKGDDVAQKDKEKPGLDTPKADDKGDKKETKKAAAEPTETAPPPGGEAPTEPGGPIGKPGTKPAGGGTAAAPGGTAAAKPTTTAGDKPAPTTTSPGTKCTSLDCMMGGAGTKEPPKPVETAKPAAGGAEFDKAAAKSALSSVPYKDCGSGGAGKITVTFSPSGSVSSAVVTSGEYDGGTKSCIQNRFKGAKVPAFSGDPKPVGWSINL